METKSQPPTILVTGFGPFGNYNVNPSWAAVQLLPEMFSKWEKSNQYNLIIEEMPVIYKHVTERIKELWIKHKPRIILNVGVSNKAKCLTLECKANSMGYIRKDELKESPVENNNDDNIILNTRCDLQKLCELINEDSSTECKACVSIDAGKFLCEYIYYSSLSLKQPLSLFIHIPETKIYSSETTTEGIFKILTYLIGCISEQECQIEE